MWKFESGHLVHQLAHPHTNSLFSSFLPRLISLLDVQDESDLPRDMMAFEPGDSDSVSGLYPSLTQGLVT